jgi:hypothetical protein
MSYRMSYSQNRSIFHVSECFGSFHGAENDRVESIKSIDNKEEDLRFKYRSCSTIHSTCEYCGSQNLQEYDVWVEPEEDSLESELILRGVQQICGDCRAIQY